MNPKHTPTPWKVKYRHTYGTSEAIAIIADNVGVVATACSSNFSIEQRLANAEYVVRAANAHEELLEVARLSDRYLTKLIEDNDFIDLPRQLIDLLIDWRKTVGAAIAKAEGD